jgi:hypothetical protein
MPKLICAKCQIALRTVHVGAVCVEMFGQPPRPYKVWACDALQCPSCGATVLAGFPDWPLAEHWQPGFAETLRQIEAAPGNAGWVRCEYEKVCDCFPSGGS